MLQTSMQRWIFLALGVAFTALGIVGAFVPLLPTTIFLIVAAGFFARSSPRLESWILDHPRLGPPVRAWRQNRAIPRRAKILACLGMAASFVIFVTLSRPSLPLASLVGFILAGCAAFVVTRPLPPAA